MAGLVDTDTDYYGRRAREYEEIYSKPERQGDLERLRALIPEPFSGRRVLEIACGTGYWTPYLLQTAREVVAVDAAPETLEIARAKGMPEDRVSFHVGDAYDLPSDLGPFEAAFAGFWWSHVPISRQQEFLTGLGKTLRPGSPVVLLDNRYVEGSSTPIGRRDAEGNTYQRRRLKDGSEHWVLKNFPSREQRLGVAEKWGHRAEVLELEYFWILRFETLEEPGR